MVNKVYQRTVEGETVEMKLVLFEVMLNVIMMMMMMMIAGKGYYCGSVADVEEGRRGDCDGVVCDDGDDECFGFSVVVEMGAREGVGEEDGGFEGKERWVHAMFVGGEQKKNGDGGGNHEERRKEEKLD
ncbi:hypothetical protein L6452_08365 [Arctium lappa]|uniref:Uncharacterized protein n=1 Tax=Arctium lappa TaxID=4217 RepID=A0ACB9DHD0_ARCLA|nr:hypothetical protein L6452_08365 [Arctium lappa]